MVHESSVSAEDLMQDSSDCYMRALLLRYSLLEEEVTDGHWELPLGLGMPHVVDEEVCNGGLATACIGGNP